ncbi:glycosyltransferase [Spongisporangium articulatum]|uniref:Glycosyltransferase n=1 Tax=Spongisporangium articulatum TaxID=3362603 RepID=A0ABW8AJA7_9ACTN
MPESAHKYELVIVSYRSRPQVEGLLAGLDPETPFVVVDNSGDRDGISTVAAQARHGRYLNGGGHGFAKAANLGARSSGYDYVIFVNPDTRPTDADLAALVGDLADDPRLASVAATPLGGDGRTEIGAGGWEPSVRRAVVHALGLHKVLPTAGLFARPRANLPLRVDWTTGACMAVRTSTFESLGAFDEQFYVYNEDVTFGRTVREAGLRQSLRTDVLVPHGSGNSGAPSKEMMRLRGASMARYVNQHNSPAASSVIRAALASGYLTRVIQQLLKRDFARAGEHFAYVQGVMTGTATVGGKEVTST